LVKRLAREHVFAFADEYLVRESRLRGQPRGVDPPGAVEEGAFYAEHLFAKAGAGRLTEPIVETRVTDGGGIHRRELELAIEPLLDQRIERRVRGCRRRPRDAGDDQHGG